MARRTRAFLTLTAYNATVITSAMFVTAAAAAPILFGGGYVSLGAWWRVGLIVSVVNIAIWVGVGAAWWRVLGL